MDEITKFNTIKDTFYELSKSHKNITLAQIKEASGIENPEYEIDLLKRRGIIIQVATEEFMWV